MGLLVAWGDDANFVVSVGGFHPQFNPPPLPFPSPQRVAARHHQRVLRADPRRGYFAVTSNTAQFGASVGVLLRLLGAERRRGTPSFDALIQFSPFHFSVSISTSFSVSVFGVGRIGYRHRR